MRNVLTQDRRFLMLLINILLVLIMVLPGSTAEAETNVQVQVTELNPVVEVHPNQPITLLFRVTNPTAYELEVIPVLTLPPGWTEVVPASSLTLRPGEGQTSMVTVRAYSGAPAGDYTVELAYLTQGSTLKDPEHAAATFTVHLNEVSEVDVVLLNAPSYTLSEPYTATFMVQNKGNVSVALRLAVEDNLGFKISVNPAEVLLAPGDSEIIDVYVDVKQGVDKVRRHRVTLTTRSIGDFRIDLDKDVWVDIIPISSSPRLAYHHFPLQLKLGISTSFLGLPGIEWSLEGRGTLSDRDPGQLGVSLSRHRWNIRYTRNALTLNAGTQYFSLSPLTISHFYANGLTVRYEREKWIGQAFYALHKDGNRFGTSVLYRASDRMSLTLRHAAGSDSSGGRWTLAAQVTPLERWTTEIEVGVDTEASGEESLPNAAWIASTLSLGPSTTRVDFRQNEKGYLGSGAERFVAVSQDLQITDNHRLTLRWNSYRGFADGLGSNVLRERKRLGAAVSSSLQSGYWNIRYSQTDTDYGERLDRRLGISWNNHWLRETSRISARLDLREENDRIEDTRLAWSELRVNYRLPITNGQIRASLDIERTLEGERDDRAGLALTWSQRVQKWLADLTLSADDFLTKAYSLRRSIGYGSEEQGLFQIDGRYALRADGSSSFQVTAGYKVSLGVSVPVSRRHNVGSVAGRVVNEEGQGIAGILVRLNDLVTRTELDGSYEFPVVPVGDGCLMVDPFDIGIGRIVRPATPVCFRIKAGEKVIQNLELIPAARVSGVIEIEPLPQTMTGENAVFGHGQETDASILNGTVIELRSGDEVHRQVIRVSKGDEKTYKAHFRFDQVLPGDWEMVVHLSSAALKAYSVEYPRRIIQVGPGEFYEAEVKVVPVRREIRFVESGVLAPIQQQQP